MGASPPDHSVALAVIGLLGLFVTGVFGPIVVAVVKKRFGSSDPDDGDEGARGRPVTLFNALHDLGDAQLEIDGLKRQLVTVTEERDQARHDYAVCQGREQMLERQLDELRR